MKNYFRLTPQAGLFAFLLFIFSNALAQTSPTISYQGVLENNGAAVNGNDTLKIVIYQFATGGTPLYTETQSVDVANGIFNVAIGSVTPLLPTLDFTKQYYLAVSVNGGAELTPRSLVSFAPYAYRALYGDTAIYATKANVANGVSGGVVNSLNGETGTITLSGNNGITVSNSPPNIIISSTGVQSLNTAGGKLTLVGAGGTTVTDTGSVLTIRSATFTGGTGIQAVQNSDNAISITNGSGPIATLGLAQQNATTGQMLIWNGSAWRPSSGSFAGIQNIDSTISITSKGAIDTIGLARQSASTGQILQWNGSAWRPATVSGVGADSIKNLGDARVNIPSGNLYLGAGAGTHSSSAVGNVAVGIGAMDSMQSGVGNVAIGSQTLQYDISGRDNVAVGAQALNANTGSFNTVVGEEAMLGYPYSADSASSNCAFGYRALYGIGGQPNMTENVAVGTYALDVETGSFNVAVGASSLEGNYGSSNTAVGCLAMENAIHTSHLVAVGDSALLQDGTGSTPSGDSATENTAIGSASLSRNNRGAYNTATGFQTLHQNGSGYHNTANGASSLWNNTGSYNTATGSQSLIANTSGNNNSAFGYLALSQNTTGSNNAAFGDNSGPQSSGLGNTTSIGSGAQASASNSMVLGNANVTTLYCQGAYAATTANSANMYVAPNGQIMRSTSSARYKTNIHDLDINTDRLYDLRPVSYTSKIDGKEYFGLVAEDVAKVLPDLAEYARSKDVIPGSDSDDMIPDAVKYPMLSVLLLDELKKEHARAESQEKIITDLTRRVEALEASQKTAK